ncbi:MAG: glycosyl hydrolase family 18 protein [Firmicutes bacterium]|nr:glycosyl hydrolase family 18 protein [Bacillota bacterium]
MTEYIVNGYAYPSISKETLEWWLPRLSWVAAFSYGFTEDGNLINLEDANLIIPATEAGVRPMMVLTPLDADGNFNDNIAIRVFENPDAQQNLIDNIEANIKNKNMGGVDFDFEYLAADYADDYVELVGRTRGRLRPQGYLTTVALAPKVSTDQPGLLYQGHDYAGMGQAADYCLLMTYEWGYTYGPPLPVSPINSVRRVLDYGVTQIPPEKILMGMSNYGYDWRLPFVQGESKAEKLTNYQALARAEYYGVDVQYDEEAQAPFFTYTSPDGSEHIVWFEDERSWRARLALVEEYGLAGISIWNIMHIFYGGI